MTAEEAVNFIHQRAWRGSKPGLSRTEKLLALLGDPQERTPCVHIAGTNGKGSTAAMLSSVLTAAGYKTGLFTSPYISRFNERIKIDGEDIPDAALGELTDRLAPLALSMEDRPTEFELVTVIAFEHFAREGCDIAVLETGMGGRLDSTNVIRRPLCSVITNIGLDHTRELGDTATLIAAEKAGIIKENRPTVIYDLPENVRRVIENRCEEKDSPLVRADFGELRPISDGIGGQRFSYKAFSGLYTPLLGAHQLKNAAVALETIEVLRRQGFDIPEKAVAEGLSAARWPARFELLAKEPFFVVDGGHNPQCAEAVADNLRRYFPGRRKVVLMGVLRDKDFKAMLRALLPEAEEFVTITPNSPRALEAPELARAITGLGRPARLAGSVIEGIETAIALAGKDGAVCSVGSLYTAGEVRAYFGS